VSEQKTFKKGDRVHIHSLDTDGEVQRERIPGETADDEFYVVKTIHYCRPSDLELLDEHREAERKKHEAESQKRFDRFVRAHEKIMAGDTSREAVLEYISAANEHSVAMGRPPLFIKK
jgi:hypothetical protein